MDHKDIGVLLEVVDCGSVLGAARKLGISRSSLRRRLEELEAEIGVPLLVLDTGGARLTAAGAVAVEQGRSVLESCRKLVDDARAAAGEATGGIRVIAPVGMPLTMRVQILLATHSAAPKLRIAIREVDDPMAYLNEPCELVLHDGPAPEKSTWFSRVVRRQTLRVLAAPSYLAARGVPRSVSDLAEHDILGWERPRTPSDVWPLLAGGTVKVSPWLRSPDFLLVRTLASQGCGLLLASQDPALYEHDAEPMVPVLQDLVGCDLLFRVSSPLSTTSDIRTHRTLEQIRSVLSGLPEP
jgi:DNA-binding transcriptional LysR family regulator